MFHPSVLWAALSGEAQGFRLKPWKHIPDIRSLNESELHQEGVRGIIFDADNTLTGHGKPEIEPNLLEAYNYLSQRFTCVIFSNCSRERHAELEEIFAGVPVVPHTYRKPLDGGYEWAFRTMEMGPEQTLMIGDRLLTDILGAQRIGMRSVLVDPFDPDEPVTVHQVRRYERWRLGIDPAPTTMSVSQLGKSSPSRRKE